MPVAINQYIGNTDRFPILGKWLFMNHAGVAPIPHCGADALRQFAREAEESAYLEGNWYRQVEQLRSQAATLINAERGEIAFVKNTSEGLSLVAGGLDWQPGDRVVTTEVEYPANLYPWMDLGQRKQVDLIRVPERMREDGARVIDPADIFQAASHPRTRLVTLSHVEFGSGFRHDIASIGRFCRERGILFCVDGIQSLGVIPVDVKAMNIDYLSADGHKWLLGPEGAGIFYCRRELIEKTHPVLIGWLNVAGALDFSRIEYKLKSDASRFECGSWNIPGLLGLKASLELLTSVGIEAVSQRVHQLTDHLAAGLKGKGYTIASARDGEGWSGIVSFFRDGVDPQAAAMQLKKDHRVEMAVRAGRMRVSPHFYNTQQQVDQLLEWLP